MNEKITAAIDVVAGKITAASSHDEALKFSQAVLNLTHAQVMLENAERATQFGSVGSAR